MDRAASPPENIDSRRHPGPHDARVGGVAHSKAEGSMRSHFLPVWSLLLMCGACPIHALAQADCSQREWRLLSDYDPLLMKAFEALDWKRYATLQRQLLAQLSRNCLVALG